MKNFKSKITLLACLSMLLCAVTLSAQNVKINEKQALEKSHMDFKTMYLYFIIDNLIEYDGHTFDNSKENNPFVFHCDIKSGVLIYRSLDSTHTTLYKYKNCSKKDCKIIHLEINMTDEDKSTMPIFWKNGYMQYNNGVPLLENKIRFPNSQTLELIR